MKVKCGKMQRTFSHSLGSGTIKSVLPSLDAGERKKRLGWLDKRRPAARGQGQALGISGPESALVNLKGSASIHLLSHLNETLGRPRQSAAQISKRRGATLGFG